MSNVENTLSIIKPDAVERNLDSQIKDMFIKNGFNIIKDYGIGIEEHFQRKSGFDWCFKSI